ncbi:hypothetical protein P4607_28960 [Priestia megaterium]|uniref:hypothetical protein n=1 Tax=Priestia megaterium TaxID=1404 RepID=UPI002E21B8BD|nr:hypothetical protein [Priestia megaterium]
MNRTFKRFLLYFLSFFIVGIVVWVFLKHGDFKHSMFQAFCTALGLALGIVLTIGKEEEE